MPKPVIDPDIVAILPPLTEDELNRLRISIQADGCRDAIVVWKEKNVVIDGHNRMQICDELKVKYQIIYINFQSKELVIQWVIANQLARRNLTDELRRYYRGKDFEQAKLPVGSKHPKNGPQNEAHSKTAAVLAEKHGVSKATIERDAKFAEAVDKLPEEEKASVLAGEADVTPAQVVTAAKADKPTIYCRPCRVGTPKKGCKDCAAIRKPIKEAAKKAPEAGDADESEVVDSEGVPVPEKARSAFVVAKEIEKLCRQHDELISRIEQISKQPGGRLIRFDSYKQMMKDAKGNLWANRATHVCPYCKGKGKCEACKSEGWVAKHIFQAAPKGDK